MERCPQLTSSERDQTFTWEEPTWDSVNVVRCPQGGLGECGLNKGRCGRRMLGFLDAGPLCFPVLVSQCESNREYLRQQRNETEGVENLTGIDVVT